MDIDMYSEIVKCETCGGDCDIIGNRENVCIEYHNDGIIKAEHIACLRGWY